MPEDEHSDASSMTLRTALRTSSNRAAVQLLQLASASQNAVELRGEARRRHAAERAVAGARRRRSDARALTAAYGAFANGGVVRDTDADPARRGQPTARCCIRRAGKSHQRGQRDDGLPDGEHARGRDRRGHRLPRAADRASRCRPRARPARPTTTTTPGSSASRRISSPASGSASTSRKTIISNGYAADVAVPIWAGFMKRATKGDKPEWLDKPENVVAVNVCRLSGKLPDAGCESSQVVTQDGQLETRSMVYTEYFVARNTADDRLPHPRAAVGLDRLAGVFGKDTGFRSRPTRRSADAASDEHERSHASVSDKDHEKAAEEHTAEEPKKKRGFWSQGIRPRRQEDRRREKERRRAEERRGAQEAGGEEEPRRAQASGRAIAGCRSATSSAIVIS